MEIIKELKIFSVKDYLQEYFECLCASRITSTCYLFQNSTFFLIWPIYNSGRKSLTFNMGWSHKNTQVTTQEERVWSIICDEATEIW